MKSSAATIVGKNNHQRKEEHLLRTGIRSSSTARVGKLSRCCVALAGYTVEELARAHNLTDNEVRAHLATLERGGIVRRRGSVRRGSGGKPAYGYELTPGAEDLFPLSLTLRALSMAAV